MDWQCYSRKITKCKATPLPVNPTNFIEVHLNYEQNEQPYSGVQTKTNTHRLRCLNVTSAVPLQGKLANDISS